ALALQQAHRQQVEPRLQTARPPPAWFRWSRALLPAPRRWTRPSAQLIRPWAPQLQPRPVRLQPQRQRALHPARTRPTPELLSQEHRRACLDFPQQPPRPRRLARLLLRRPWLQRARAPRRPGLPALPGPPQPASLRRG